MRITFRPILIAAALVASLVLISERVAAQTLATHAHGQDDENYRIFALDGVTTALEPALPSEGFRHVLVQTPLKTRSATPRSPSSPSTSAAR